MRKQHDAELCERIRVLEDRISELEARPTYVPSFTHYCWPGCPQHYGTGWYYPPQWTSPTITYDTWVSNTSATTGQITTNSSGVPD